MKKALVVGGAVSNRAAVIHKVAGTKAPGEVAWAACGKKTTVCLGWLGTLEYDAEGINRAIGVKACSQCANYEPVVTFRRK